MSNLPKLNVKKSASVLALLVALPVITLQYPGFQAWGVYNRISNGIKIEPNLQDECPDPNGLITDCKKYVLEHEWAHFIWFKRMGGTDRSRYCRAYEQDFYSPSIYGRKSCIENFAEMYAYIIEDKVDYNNNRAQHRIALNAIQRYEEFEDQEGRYPEIFNWYKP